MREIGRSEVAADHTDLGVELTGSQSLFRRVAVGGSPRKGSRDAPEDGTRDDTWRARRRSEDGTDDRARGPSFGLVDDALVRLGREALLLRAHGTLGCKPRTLSPYNDSGLLRDRTVAFRAGAGASCETVSHSETAGYVLDALLIRGEQQPA
jgi:hypothetical protein